jgi:putative ABC transport system permease protein
MSIIDTDQWQEIFSTLGKHKLRTVLTCFGVFWGIFMLTVLLGAGKGLENGATEDNPRVTNSVIMWSNAATQIPYQGMPVGRYIRLRARDVTDIQQHVDSVGFIKGQNSLGLYDALTPYVVYKNKNDSFAVQGAFAGIEDLNSLKLIIGRALNEFDEQQRRKVVVIGERVKNQLFDKGDDPVGAHLTINGISFQVIGVFQSFNPNNKQAAEETLYIPNDTLRYSFNQVGWVGNFVFVPKSGISAQVAEDDVKHYLSKIKKVDPNEKGVFASYNRQNDHDKIDGLLMGIKFFSWFVAICTIMAGAIGVGNIMLIVVKERTREIGLRKALGATPVSIVMMIMQESLFITSIAGYSGLVMGTLSLEGITWLLNTGGGDAGFFRHPQIDFSTAITALIVLIIYGVLASLLPASKAAAVNPIVALQDE